jgi:hypothetical protein
MSYRQVLALCCQFDISSSNFALWRIESPEMHVTMSQDRIDKLNSIDFVWDVNAHNWNENYVSI